MFPLFPLDVSILGLIPRAFITTGIFPAESQPRGLDPQVASRKIGGHLPDSHVSVDVDVNVPVFLSLLCSHTCNTAICSHHYGNMDGY